MFQLNPVNGLRDNTTYETNPATETRVRAILQDPIDQVVAEINNMAALKPRCRVYHNIGQSIATTSYSTIAFNSERYNIGALHSTTVNNSRIIFLSGGCFSGGANVEWASNINGQRILRIMLNGTTQIAVIADSANLKDSHKQQIMFSYTFSVGDYIELQGYQDSGGSLNINLISNYSPEMWVQKEA